MTYSRSADHSSSSRGIGCIGVLQIVFIVLKLRGKIDWTWGWVLAPTWIGAILAVLFLIGLVIFYKIIKKY